MFYSIFLIDSVPKCLLQMLNTRNVSKTTFDGNLFSYVTLYFAIQRTDLIPFLLFWYCCFYVMNT